MFQVNRELKKLLVASVGDDLQYHFERLSREKNQLILENEALGRSLAHTAEQLERMSIQCDVWRSKFLASRYEIDQIIVTNGNGWKLKGKAFYFRALPASLLSSSKHLSGTFEYFRRRKNKNFEYYSTRINKR